MASPNTTGKAALTRPSGFVTSAFSKTHICFLDRQHHTMLCPGGIGVAWSHRHSALNQMPCLIFSSASKQLFYMWPSRTGNDMVSGGRPHITTRLWRQLRTHTSRKPHQDILTVQLAGNGGLSQPSGVCNLRMSRPRSQSTQLSPPPHPHR